MIDLLLLFIAIPLYGILLCLEGILHEIRKRAK